MTEMQKTGPMAPQAVPLRATEQRYDMRRLSYAGTFTNPFKAGSIRAIEWITAKLKP